MYMYVREANDIALSLLSPPTRWALVCVRAREYYLISYKLQCNNCHPHEQKYTPRSEVSNNIPWGL